MAWEGIIRRYRDFLPVSETTPVITLGEGNTPLLPVPRFAEAIGCKAEVFVKCEGFNPTGSFKDRGMTLAVSKAKEEGSEAVLCASTGNTSASAAAFASRCGIRCIVLLPDGDIALGKLSQALMHGADVIAIEGTFDQALQLARELTAKLPITLVNSINPYRLEGQKTAAFEVCDQLEDAPDYLSIPVGNAGNITAYWRGFREYRQAGRSSRLPKMLGFQAAGAAPIVAGRVVEDPQTLATAIKIGHPASWEGAVAARDESGGLIDMVTDEEILDAYRLIAREGVFCEPASAASLAGVAKLARKGMFKKGEQIVCVLTGHGLKDPDRAIATADRPKVTAADAKAVEDALFQTEKGA